MKFELSNDLPFQAAFEQTPLGMFFSDQDGGFVAVNLALTMQMQQPAKALIGSSVTRWFTPLHALVHPLGNIAHASVDSANVDSANTDSADADSANIGSIDDDNTNKNETGFEAVVYDDTERDVALNTNSKANDSANHNRLSGDAIHNHTRNDEVQHDTIQNDGVARSVSQPRDSQTKHSQLEDSQPRHLQGYYQLHDDPSSDGSPRVWHFTTVYLEQQALYVTTLVQVSLNETLTNMPITTANHQLRNPVSDTVSDTVSNTEDNISHDDIHAPTLYERDHLRALYDVIPDGILYFDRDGICTNVKQPNAFSTYRPYTGTVGKHISSDLPAADAAQARAALEALFTTGQTQYFEHAISVDGHIQYRENRFVKINDQTGLVLVRDVTAQKRTEHALRESEGLFRSFFEDNPVPCLLVLDENAHNKKDAFMLNRAYRDFLTCTEDDLHGLSLGQFIERFMHPEDILRERPFNEEVKIGVRSHYTIEKRYLRSDGTTRWGVLNNLIVRNSEGGFVRSIGIVQDITERKNAAQAMRDQQEQLLAIYQALPDAIIRINRQGYYLAFKPPKSLVLYDDPTQTIGRHISENVPAEVAKLVLHYLNRLFDTGNPQQFEHTLVVGGQLRYRENRLVKLNDYEALVITRDITDRKRAEVSAQIQSERLLALYQGIPDGIAVITREGVMLESKPPRSYDPYHFTQLNVGDSIEDNAPEHVARLVREKLAALFATGEMQEYVYSLYTAGETRYREGRLVQLNDYEALSIVRDITEQQRTENALNTEKEHLRVLYEALPDAIVHFNRQGVYLSVKPMAESDTYIPVDAMLQHQVEDNIPPEAAALARQYGNAMFATGQNQRYEYTIAIGDELRYRENRLVKLNDDEGIAIIRDITEQRQAENALRAEREHLFALYQAIPDTIIRMNRAGVYLDYKPSSYFKPYIDPANTLGKTLFDNTPPEVAKRAYQHIDALFTTGEMQQFENTLMIDGNVHYRENRWVKVGSDEIIAIVRDISEQKRAEAALKAEKEHLWRLYQAIPEQIVRFDKRGTILDYKPASDFPASSTPERAIGRSLLEVAENPEVGAETMHYVDQAFASGEIQSFEQHFTHNGEVHYRDHRLVKVSDDEAITLIRDTTEKRRAERALQESKQRLDLAINAAKLGIWDRYIDQPTATVNDNYRAMLGIPADETITVQRVRRDIHPDDFALAQADFAELYSGSKPQHGHERRQRHRDGSYRWIRVSGAIVEHDSLGQPHRFVSVVQDIHEQKTTQLRLEETLLELEQALRDKDILLAEVHHRVKNNMQVIGSIMSLHARDANEPAAKAALLASRARIRAMAAIHEVMYNTEIFSDLEFSTYLQTIARSLVQLHYRDVTHQTRPLPHLHFDLAPVSLSLQDALPCALIFNELLSNALKHAFPNDYEGKPMVTVRLQETADTITLQVIDNGVGSSNAVRNFGSFIVESLVEQLQGKLDISSPARADLSLSATPESSPNIHTESDPATDLKIDANTDPETDPETDSETDPETNNNPDSETTTGTMATLRFAKVMLL